MYTNHMVNSKSRTESNMSQPQLYLNQTGSTCFSLRRERVIFSISFAKITQLAIKVPVGPLRNRGPTSVELGSEVELTTLNFFTLKSDFCGFDKTKTLAGWPRFDKA
jgi:hypothetical protein